MNSRARGFTVIELMIAVTVAGIILALAMPSYSEILNKRAVTSAAEQLSTNIALARSEAVKRDLQVTVKIDADADGFCLGLTSAADCDCFQPDTTAANYCEITDGGQDTRVILTSESLERVAMPPQFNPGPPLRFTFDPVRGLLDSSNDLNGEILLTSENDRFALRVDTSLAGRVELCTLADKRVAGYKLCQGGG